MVNGENHPVALLQGHYFSPGLHARPLLREHELTAGKILPGLREQDGDLQWEDELTVEVLMEAVVVARCVLEQQWRRSRLPCLRTLSEVFSVAARIANA